METPESIWRSKAGNQPYLLSFDSGGEYLCFFHELKGEEQGKKLWLCTEWSSLHLDCSQFLENCSLSISVLPSI